MPRCGGEVVKGRRACQLCELAGVRLCVGLPACAAKISEHRRKELLDLVEKHQAAGGFVYLITRTFSHKSTASLAALQGGLKVAEGKLKSGKYWQSMKADFGYVGTVRALEVTLASASGGWHPHIHELWFVASKLTTQQQEELRARMFDKWAKACAAAGLGAPSEEHGVDVRGGKDAARYISKWGMASELTKGHVKNSAKGLSPFDLLRVGLHTKDTGAAKLARDLFAEYAEAMKGRQQLVWSNGLRKNTPSRTRTMPRWSKAPNPMRRCWAAWTWTNGAPSCGPSAGANCWKPSTQRTANGRQRWPSSPRRWHNTKGVSGGTP